MLEVTGLESGYGAIPILSGVSISVARGEVVGVLGHNGMGKTTLLRTLIGALPVTAGRIVLDGADITAFSMARRARLGMRLVPQGREIFPELTVRENLTMGEIANPGESLIPEMLTHFPILEGLLDRAGRTLSGGEQQLLALARCLVGRPRLILLDEPSEGIQPSIVKEIIARLRAFLESWGLTVLLIEQNLDLIAALAGRVLIMRKGAITAEIEPAQLADRQAVGDYMGG